MQKKNWGIAGSACLGAVLLISAGFAPVSRARGADTTAPAGGPSPAQNIAFQSQFVKTIWPMLQTSCTGCHNASNPSSLHFNSTAVSSFHSLLAGGYLDPQNPESLLSRVASPIPSSLMPPAPYHKWTEAQCNVLRSFCSALYAGRTGANLQAANADRFPAALLQPYHGPWPAQSNDNTFLTWYQLRNKIYTLFGDHWNRNGKNLFEQDIAQFGGADFVARFNETATPSAEYLSALDSLAADVSARAYLNHTGPFNGLNTNLPPPSGSVPSAAYRHNIVLLYQRMLFRPPTPVEMEQTWRFMRAVYAQKKLLADQPAAVDFRLTARNEFGQTATEDCAVPLVNGALGEVQSNVNENNCTQTLPPGKEALHALNGPVLLKAGDTRQKLVVSNQDTSGEVLVSGIAIVGPLPSTQTQIIDVKGHGVEATGAWKLEYPNGVASFTDSNQNKGDSILTFPLSVGADGKYNIELLWQSRPGKAEQVNGTTHYTGKLAGSVPVRVECYSPSSTATPSAPAVPSKGTARFIIDQSNDAVKFWKFAPLFRFGAQDGLVVSDKGTRRQVVADVVRFRPAAPTAQDVFPPQPVSHAGSFTVATLQADGQQSWQVFQKPTYLFYQPVGKRVVSDKGTGKAKGHLFLFYHPSSPLWKPEGFYHVQFGYPATEQNSRSVPVFIHASASSPILSITTPIRAHAGALVTLDASGSYDVQHTPLQLTWEQLGGPRVQIADPHAAKITFRAPVLAPEQAVWQGLCEALIKHPDFLFTRPLSLATEKNAVVRKQLQLVKIAQDLVARPPMPSEIAAVDHGVSLADMINKYMEMPEFGRFYFRRVRLFLESHGTPVDDEPARLWTWIMLHDRSYKQILDADYTVNADWQKTSRPAYYGHSGVLTMAGFIQGKPSLPHFNYSAQVMEKFMGYVFVVSEKIIKMREGITATSTVTPGTVCFTCHQVLTPLAYQRRRFTDDGVYRMYNKQHQLIDDSDRDLVPSYPYRGEGMQAFATKAVNTEAYIRTMMQTHFVFYFGREMHYNQEERGLYRHLWLIEKKNNYNIKGLIRAIMLSPQYLNGTTPHPAAARLKHPSHLAMQSGRKGGSHA